MPLQLVERLDVAVDSWELLERYLKLAIETCFRSPEEMALRFVDRDEEGRPDVRSISQEYFPVLLLHGGSKLTNPDSYFNGLEPSRVFDLQQTSGLQYMLDIVKAELLHGHPEWRHAFRQFRGDGFSHSFMHSDGDVVTGYRLITTCSFPAYLAICLTHIYYGK